MWLELKKNMSNYKTVGVLFTPNFGFSVFDLTLEKLTEFAWFLHFYENY